MRLKILIILLVFLLGIQVLSGCKKTPEEPYVETLPLPIGDEIYIRNYLSAEQTAQILNEELTASFHSSFPHNTLTITQGNSENIVSEILALQQTGERIDLICSPQVKLLYFADILKPYDRYLNKNDFDNLNDMHRMVADLNTIDGKLYGIAPFGYVWMMAYNKDVFEENGYTPPKTWQEMLEFQKLFTVYGENSLVVQTGFADMSFGFGIPFVACNYYNGENYVNDPGYIININTESMLNLLKFYKELEDCFGGKSNLDKSFIQGYPGAFANKNTLMTITRSPNDLNNLDFNVGFMAFPNDESASEQFIVGSQREVFTLSKDTKNPYGAAMFLNWYVKDGILEVIENNNYQQNKENYFPRFLTNNQARERCYYMFLEDYYDSNKNIDNIKIRDELMNKINRYQHSNAVPEAYNAGFDLVKDAILQPNDYSSISEVLVEAQRRANEVRDSWFEQKYAEGWVIDEENPWGVPPSSEGS